ncbi:MAG: acylphosphatase [Devosia sp.]|nr:acylphosphatase [Devosia sp.]
MKAVRVIVRGRVQGVGYRAWLEVAAGARRLDGWVRNRRDGTVEAVVSGPDEAVEEILAALWQGPPAALVSEVEILPHAGPIGGGFAARPTA